MLDKTVMNLSQLALTFTIESFWVRKNEYIITVVNVHSSSTGGHQHPITFTANPFLLKQYTPAVLLKQ
jgi:hypothetical protein